MSQSKLPVKESESEPDPEADSEAERERKKLLAQAEKERKKRVAEEEKAAPPAKSAPAKPVQKTGDFSVNPTKPGKKTYTKKGAESSDLSDAALAEKLQSKF